MRKAGIVAFVCLAGLSLFAGYRYQAMLTVSGYSGSSTLSGFPVLVRISPDTISGFSYDKLTDPDNGTDIRFLDTAGNVLPHEIDTWDKTGTSLVWVRLPSLAGKDTSFCFQFGSDDAITPGSSRNVWCDANGGFYAGVWHMSETISSNDAPTTASMDSAKYDPSLVMDAAPYGGRMFEMTNEQAVVGCGRVNNVQWGDGGRNYLLTADYSSMALGSSFTASGWFRLHDFDGAQRALLSTALNYYTLADTGWLLWAPNQWYFCFYKKNPGANTGNLYGGITIDKYFHCAVTVTPDDTNVIVRIYFNGKQIDVDKTLAGPISDNSRGLFIGAMAGGGCNVSGAFDEIRLLSKPGSADWVKAEYETASVSNYVTASAFKILRDACIVTAVPEELGTPDPDYGMMTELADGQVVPFTAPSGTIGGGDDLRYRFAGWSLYGQNDDETFSLLESGKGVSHDYTHVRGNSVRKFVWDIVRQRALTASVSPQNGGTIVAGGVTLATDGTKNWIDESAAVAIRAVPADGWRFLSWLSGPVADPTAAETTVSMLTAGEVTAAFVYEGPAHEPQEVTWKGTEPGLWSDAANWDGGVPQCGDTVYLTAESAKIIIDGPTPTLGVLVIGDAGNTGVTTLVVSNWFSQISAESVTVTAKGRIVLEGAFADNEPSNRIWIAAQNLTVEKGGEICADAAGYAAYNGPGWEGVTPQIEANWGGRQGGAYGGQSGKNNGYNATYTVPYGNAEWPYQPGTGGSAGGTQNPKVSLAGGGAILLDVAETLRVDGLVTADGAEYADWFCYTGTGSGGGVVVKCGQLVGTGSIRASGHNRKVSSVRQGGASASGGSGGRIAVHYNPSLQQNASCSVGFDVSGTALAMGTVVQGGLTNRLIYLSQAGTLWFPDNQLLTAPDFVVAGWPFAGRWTTPVPLEEIVIAGDLLITNKVARPEFEQPDVRIRVGGNLSLRGLDTGMSGLFIHDLESLEIGGDLTIGGASLETVGGTVTVHGNLTQGTFGRSNLPHLNGGVLQLTAAPTNTPESVGASLVVDGRWTIDDQAACVPVCDPTNGAIVAMSARWLTLASGGLISANQTGWAAGYGPGAGYDYAYLYNIGASHGGLGGKYYPQGYDPNGIYKDLTSRPAYDSEEHPCEPGSGSAVSYSVAGGGVVMLSVARTAVIDGEIRANGGEASSGGTVNLSIHKLKPSTGTVAADGGTSISHAPGGGGRVAVWTGNDPTGCGLTLRANARTDYPEAVTPGEISGKPNLYYAPTVGTTYWGQLEDGLGFSVIVR